MLRDILTLIDAAPILEILLGGVTRKLNENPNIRILMAHWTAACLYSRPPYLRTHTVRD